MKGRLHARGVCVRYGGGRARSAGRGGAGEGRTVLDAVDLELRSGEAVALVGANGAGKSTLLRVLAGVQRPDAGEVRVGEGVDVLRADRRAVAHEVGLATQYAELHVPLRALEVAALGLYAHGAVWRALAEAERARVRAALAAFGVLERADQPMPSLSGGEQQRVRLASVRVQAPPVLLLDEPTSAQDLDGAARVAAWIQEHCAGGGAALVAVHDLSFAARAFGRMVVLGSGRILADGPPASVLTSEAMEAAYGRRPAVHRDEEGQLWVAPALTRNEEG